MLRRVSWTTPDGEATITCACPALVNDPAAGRNRFVPCATDVEITRTPNGAYVLPRECPSGEHGEFTSRDTLDLLYAAREAYDNYDPSDAELRAAGMLV